MNGRYVKPFLAFTLLIAAFALAACDAAVPAAQVTATPKATQPPKLTGTETSKVVSITGTPTRTRVPSLMPDLTWVAIYEIEKVTQSVFETQVVEFPYQCPEYTHYYQEWFKSISPDGLWYGEYCLLDEEGSALVISNKETGAVWKMRYIDFLGPVDFADGGMGIAHWSADSRYVYFYSTLGGCGGYCFYGGNTCVGLFRLDVLTGQISEILPPNTVFYWYRFSISPNGRLLVFGKQTEYLKILDMVTGDSIDVQYARIYDHGEAFVWAPDGSQFVYSTDYFPHYEETEMDGFTLRLVDAQTGEERILLESKTSCYRVREWREDNVIVIDYDDENYDRAIMEYDLNTDTILGNPPPSSP